MEQKRLKARQDLYRFWKKSERETIAFFKVRGIVDDGSPFNPVGLSRRSLYQQYVKNLSVI